MKRSIDYLLKDIAEVYFFGDFNVRFGALLFIHYCM
jgi:hypothetical protein